VEVVWATYAGQEQRSKSASARFGRGWEHGTARGNDNIAELCYDTSRRTAVKGACRCMPWGEMTIHRRTLGFLPLDAGLVNTDETALLALLGGAGAVVLNYSAVGEGRWWLADECTGGAPRYLTVGNALIEQSGL
jgi:hypothetical protein